MQFVPTFLGYVYVCLMFSNWRVLVTQHDQGIYFQFLTENFLLLKKAFSSLTINSYSSDRNGCVSYCLTNPNCKSSNFRISTRECSLFELNSWGSEFNIVSDTDGIIIQKMNEPVVTHGEWTMVFRALANIKKSVYDAYIDTSLSHDQPINLLYPIGCLRLDTNLSCDHHFRSRLLNKWSNLKISEVKFAIFKDGALQNFITFNGSTTTYLSWFSSANLLISSWGDLRSSSTVSFSIAGYKNGNSIRRFYVEKTNPGCDVDTGWVVCVDKLTDWCPWAMKGTSYPRLLYSPTSIMSLNKDMFAADIFAVFIKY